VPVRLSVIIPAHDGAELLEDCLTALDQADCRDYECIVVDDASQQDIRSVSARHGARYLRLEQQRGPAAARNRGAAEARGDILVFFDVDVCAHRDTLSQLEGHLQQHPACSAVIGSYDDSPRDPHLVSQFKNLLHHYVHQSSRAEAWTFWTGCGAIRRQAFVASGGFDESYTRPSIEDIEFGGRLCRAGQRIDLAAHIQVTHLKRWTLTNLIRTDVLDRGVPWLLLMWRQGTMPSDLNLQRSHRASVVLAWLFGALALAGIAFADVRWLAVLLAITAAALLLLLNRRVYLFFARKRGLRFACAAVGLHWLYYAYSGLAVAIALPVHLRTQRRRSNRSDKVAAS